MIDKMDYDIVDKNRELIKKYPWLIPTNGWNDEIPDDYDYSYTLFDDIPFGWRKAFGRIMIEEIQEYLERIDAVDSYRISQIKEKFGSLRWYSNGDAIDFDLHNISDIECKYEVISEHICINCGRLDMPIVNIRGYFSPYCPDCYYKIIKTIGCNDNITDVVKVYKDIPNNEWIIPEEYTTTIHSEHGGHKLKHDISETVNKIREYNENTI